MTWAKVDDRFNDDPRLLSLERGVRLLHIEGIVWCCRHLTDGHVPRYALAKVTDEPDAVNGVDALVEAGLWEPQGEGWLIVDYLRDQSSAADVENIRKLARDRQRKQRQHKAGDHSLCTDPRYCQFLRESQSESQRESRHPIQSNPTRPNGKGKGKDERRSVGPPLEGAASLGAVPGPLRANFPKANGR